MSYPVCTEGLGKYKLLQTLIGQTLSRCVWKLFAFGRTGWKKKKTFKKQLHKKVNTNVQ